MQNTTKYTTKIISLSQSKGVELNDDEALEVFKRLVKLVEVVYQPINNGRQYKYRRKNAGE
jgi:hypothetical protein